MSYVEPRDRPKECVGLRACGLTSVASPLRWGGGGGGHELEGGPGGGGGGRASGGARGTRRRRRTSGGLALACGTRGTSGPRTVRPEDDLRKGPQPNAPALDACVARRRRAAVIRIPPGTELQCNARALRRGADGTGTKARDQTPPPLHRGLPFEGGGGGAGGCVAQATTRFDHRACAPSPLGNNRRPLPELSAMRPHSAPAPSPRPALSRCVKSQRCGTRLEMTEEGPARAGGQGRERLMVADTRVREATWDRGGGGAKAPPTRATGKQTRCSARGGRRTDPERGPPDGPPASADARMASKGPGLPWGRAPDAAPSGVAGQGVYAQNLRDPPPHHWPQPEGRAQGAVHQKG